MSAKQTRKRLEEVLLHDGEMNRALYEDELKESLDDLKSSMKRDNEDFLFALTVNQDDVAMVLLETSGDVHVNEAARERLKTLWPAAYESNWKRFLPLVINDLEKGEISITGCIIAE